ncbi:MAG TPA: Rne/Rng family ribonuclease [Pyrinomonadaceae bacterium]|nr:Rne/Rng family ribonuclease [Pyrinomonadaceae bacterium]
MAKELIVSVNGREKKIAIIENEKVTEFYIERGEGNQGIVGNIYKGRVMRVLPGMQSAFVDIGLERDAFLYVSDFFDEEEEFERIVIDKSKKGDVVEAQRAATEQIEMGRVEREHHIEATQERVEPLREMEQETAAEAEPEVAEQAEAGRRRSKRGRRRGRGMEGTDERDVAPESRDTRIMPEDIDTPFVAADPSVHRIVDEDESAAVNGEMFKDARLQERLLDQIHAGEFNLEDDFRTAEVGSLMSSVDYRDGGFQRIDDSEAAEPDPATLPRTREPIAAHIEGFVDNVDETPLRSGGFQRVSDEDDAQTQTETAASGAAELIQEEAEKPARGRSSSKKSRLGKLLNSVSGKKKATSKRSSKKSAKQVADEGGSNESAADATAEYPDAEVTLDEKRTRAEFATRRGGRRRRRPTKSNASETSESPAIADGNGDDEMPEVAAEPEVEQEPLAIEKSAAPAAAAPPPSRERGRGGRGGPGQRGFSRRDRQQPTITDLLREGQEILVQIAKEPIAKKGARITSHIALPGRFLVYMPTVEHVGVSRKIESDSERQRLRKLITLIRGSEDIPSGGFIVRTAGVGISEADLREDVRYLVRTWLDIRAAAEKTKPATMVHKDLDLVQRILRDQLSDDFAAIRVDSEEEYQNIVEFVNRIHPRMVKRVKLYTRDQPILETYGVQAEIDKAIKPRVWLKSGGYLVINQTEALVAIDVNTGKFVGRGSGRLEDTITRTNLEAVDEIVRQIRLRDLGGIIVLDLIDMEERRNRQRVMTALQDALRGDKSPTKVLSFNDFGLVIMTRKRVKQSLERTLCAPCQYCQGAGLIKSPQTVAYELLEEARTLGKAMNGNRKNQQATLRIHPEVARVLRGPERDVLNEIEEYLGPVDINSDTTIHQEQFDFAFI